MYRIKMGQAYDGCIPVTVWYVQMHVTIVFVYAGWVNIKGYDKREKAQRLLDILNGKDI